MQMTKKQNRILLLSVPDELHLIELVCMICLYSIEKTIKREKEQENNNNRNIESLSTFQHINMDPIPVVQYILYYFTSFSIAFMIICISIH